MRPTHRHEKLVRVPDGNAMWIDCHVPWAGSSSRQRKISGDNLQAPRLSTMSFEAGDENEAEYVIYMR